MKTTKFLTSMLVMIALAFTACTNANDPDGPDKDDPKTENKLPFSEKFDLGMGQFTQQSVTGDQVWEYTAQYKYVLISGFVDQANNANEDWLISPQIDLAGVTAAKLSFEHASRYFGNIAEEATVWVSENYVDGLPATATWTKLTTPAFTDRGDWTMVSSGEISLTAFAGKKIKIALKYVSTANKAGSWQLKNFLVQEGEAETTATGGGDTDATALTVADAIANQTAEVKWVKGYIVGCVKNGVATFENASDALFSDFDSSTNVFIADDANETDHTKCISVKLNDQTAPADLRSAVNLLDNPGNKGKELKVKGALRAMFTSLKGVRDIADWKLEGYVAPKGEFDVPEMSIADLRAQWTGSMKKISDEKKIVGIVVTDLVGGNSTSLKNLTIVSADNSSGISIRLAANNTYSMGDKIEVSLEDLELNQYGQAIQLNNVPNVKTRKIGTGSITPVATTLADIVAGYAAFESRVVTIKGTVTSANGKWGDAANHQSNTLTSGANSIDLFVAKYANFITIAVPAGEVTITGIVGQNSSDAMPNNYQLTVRNMNDVK